MPQNQDQNFEKIVAQNPQKQKPQISQPPQNPHKPQKNFLAPVLVLRYPSF